jgi:hypothetical protein
LPTALVERHRHQIRSQAQEVEGQQAGFAASLARPERMEVRMSVRSQADGLSIQNDPVHLEATRSWGRLAELLSLYEHAPAPVRSSMSRTLFAVGMENDFALRACVQCCGRLNRGIDS